METPQKELLNLQRRLNKFLQAAYHTIKPDCAFGCITSTADEETPKNIYTNALQHINQKWLLVLDIKDFFHSVSTQRISEVFQFPPFDFDKVAATLLAKLTTYENRLPIGASTSPVLANLCCLELDFHLMELAQKNSWVYTRLILELLFLPPILLPK